MDWGIVVFIDVLGYKGLWSRHPQDNVLEAVRNIATDAVELSAETLRVYRDGADAWKDLKLETRPFSDFIAILATPFPAFPHSPVIDDGSDEYVRDGLARYSLLRIILLLVTKIISRGAALSPPMIYRGCISVGAFSSNEFAFVGPAIDEAGAMHEAAQGAFVFLTPSAASIYDSRPTYPLNRTRFPYFFEYAVPMKAGELLNTYVANPLIYQNPERCCEYVRSIDDFFGEPPLNSELWLKKKNTKDLYDALSQSSWVGWAAKQ